MSVQYRYHVADNDIGVSKDGLCSISRCPTNTSDALILLPLRGGRDAKRVRVESGQGRTETAADTLSQYAGCPLDQYLDWPRVPEELLRTGAGTVGAGLEYDHQIARAGIRELHAVCQHIERGA